MPRSVNSDSSSYQDIDENGSDIDENEESPDLGKDLEVKRLYRNKRDKWVDELPQEEKVQKVVRLSTNSNYAILTRHYVQDEELCLDSIVVQNPILKELLARVFEDFSDLNATFRSKRLIFEAPFREFFYMWDSYEELLQSEDEGFAKEFLQLFDSIIRPEVGPHVAEHKDILETGVVRFEDAWTLFQPGAEVYTMRNGHERIYEFERVSGNGHPDLNLCCKYISFDGFGFRWQRETLVLYSYEGCREITDLSIYPAELHSSEEDLYERLSLRGRKFEKLSGIHFKAYTGSWSQRTNVHGFGLPQMMENGRIVTDANSIIPVPSVKGPDVLPDPFAGLGMPSLPDPFGFPTNPPPRKAKKGTKKGKKPVKRDDYIEVIDIFDPDHVSALEFFYRFCSPTVRGFCLNTKEWGDFDVEKVHDIDFNPATFKRLVLPSDYKDLILAFVSAQMDNLDSFDDIVDGKGRGITILLRGEPGVGKTLTAEAVAEEVKKPLYTLSAGDLGHDAQSVETNLQNMLDLCHRWGAILLVDECDVFLEQRAATDIDRNKLVAVFLRLLEYYKGVIFLTTNRGGMIDRAFQSRIALVIQYPMLDSHAKKHIWETFVRPSVDFPQNDSDLTDADIDSLSKLDINGREIKNLVKTGRLLAKKKAMNLSMGHIKTVLRVQNMRLRDNEHAPEGI